MLRQFSNTATFALILAAVSTIAPPNSHAQTPLVPKTSDGCVRIATYNVSLNRSREGALEKDLKNQNKQAIAIATVIRTVQPDILLLNEIDYSDSVSNAELFESLYLRAEAEDSLENQAWPMKFVYSAAVNTGVPSGLDLNVNGKLGEPEDAWGYGRFPGQYGMAILSRFEIEEKQVRSFRELLWSEMVGAKEPQDPAALTKFYSTDTWSKLRISSKSFWDVPIVTPQGSIHILASHPTPPAFDGPEDRNGCRNHDEIKLISDYIDSADYITDDSGNRGGLSESYAFVVVGDLNSDPHDGGGANAINQLLDHPRIKASPIPVSSGARIAAETQGGANANHSGPHSQDTGDFSDRVVGNLRADYVLPSDNFSVAANGVFWPDLEDVAPRKRQAVVQCMKATDHHLVWVDIRLK